MFIKFSQDKTKYESGQIFPFLIAILCVVIVMVMITVNVGQIALFKTDVSNAADAGSISAASTMTGQLLSYGLTSDLMCGENIIKCVAIILELLLIPFPGNLITAIATLATVMSSNLSKLAKAGWDSQMAWARARKAAIQYAFNNVGVDEPRPTYEDFLAGSGKAASNASYDEYIAGISPDAKEHGMNGFSRFMSHSKTGFWVEDVFGETDDPSADLGDPMPINGYGWEWQWSVAADDWVMHNSFDDSGGNQQACLGGGLDDGCWRDYDNWVEVSVISMRMLYILDLVDLGAPQDMAANLAWAYIFVTRYPTWLAMCGWAGPLAPIIAGLFAGAEATIGRLLIKSIAFGLKFKDPSEGGMDGQQWQVENSPILVKVQRYKQGENLGLWNFRYGNSDPMLEQIDAESSSRVFVESYPGGRTSTIQPTLW